MLTIGAAAYVALMTLGYLPVPTALYGLPFVAVAPPEASLLEAAAAGDDKAVLQWLRSGQADLKQRDTGGNDALLLAVRSGSAKAVAALLNAGASLYSANAAGDNALHIAAAANQVYQIENLYARGLGLEERNGAGEAAVHVAARAGRTEALRKLAQLGAPLAAMQGEWGEFTPIMLAARSKQWAAVAVLKEFGIDYGAVEAAVAGDLDTLDTFAQNDPESLTRPAGAAKLTPMSAALLTGQVAAAEFLASKKTPVDPLLATGLPVLFLVAQRGDLAAIDFLLANGVSVNMASTEVPGQTALHYLTAYGAPEAIRHIIAKGGDVNMRDGQGRTALHLAMTRGVEPVAAAILEGKPRFDLRDNKARAPMDVPTVNPAVGKLVKRAAQAAQAQQDAPPPPQAPAAPPQPQN